MQVRLVESSDYYIISPLINDWWGGRQFSDILTKSFFDHFTGELLYYRKPLKKSFH